MQMYKNTIIINGLMRELLVYYKSLKKEISKETTEQRWCLIIIREGP